MVIQLIGGLTGYAEKQLAVSNRNALAGQPRLHGLQGQGRCRLVAGAEYLVDFPLAICRRCERQSRSLRLEHAIDEHLASGDAFAVIHNAVALFPALLSQWRGSVSGTMSLVPGTGGGGNFSVAHTSSRISMCRW